MAKTLPGAAAAAQKQKLKQSSMQKQPRSLGAGLLAIGSMLLSKRRLTSVLLLTLLLVSLLWLSMLESQQTNTTTNSSISSSINNSHHRQHHATHSDDHAASSSSSTSSNVSSSKPSQPSTSKDHSDKSLTVPSLHDKIKENKESKPNLHVPIPPTKSNTTSDSKNGNDTALSIGNTTDQATEKVPMFDMNELEAEIDQVQFQFLDFLNGEDGKSITDKTLFGGSLVKITNYDFKAAWSKLLHYSKTVSASSTYNRLDFVQLGRRTRALTINYRVLHDRKDLHPLLLYTPSSASLSTLRSILTTQIQNLTTLLYPWLSPKFTSIQNLSSSFTASRGIVFSTGKWHFELAYHAILTLKTIIGTSLPIEVHYAGPSDLDPRMLEVLNALPNVTTVNVWDLFDEEARNLGGWSIKPFAILASRFKEVMFVDADALMLQDPDKLISGSEIFKKTGSLFYQDRTIGPGSEDSKWFLEFVAFPSEYAKGNRYLKKLSSHEMESGVVVVDKGRNEVLMALLNACKMNSKVERDAVTYKHMHGDKETFWMSWEMVRTPYTFSKSYGGTIGYKDTKTGGVCGGLFHTDEYLKPLWWNGGVLKNKHHSKDNYLDFQYWAMDLHATDITWVWETQTTPFCLLPKVPKEEVFEMTAEEKGIANQFTELYKEIHGQGWDAYASKKKF